MGKFFKILGSIFFGFGTVDGMKFPKCSAKHSAQTDLDLFPKASPSSYSVLPKVTLSPEKNSSDISSNSFDYKNLVLHLREWKKQYFVDDGSRTSERQKATLDIILRDPEQDLYKLSSHGTTCAFCAPREGRVYSRSGEDPIYPPLAIAFQKIDPSGPDVLWNTYLVTHPNTLHVISPWTPAGRSESEIAEIQRFSSLITNPLSHDPRSTEQKERYRKKEVARKKWLRDYRLFELCSRAGIEKFPKTFQTFQKHKLANSEKYQEWMRQYSQLMRK